MNYADMVEPGELRTAREWVERTLHSLAGGGDVGGRAEVQCVRQGWGTFMWGRSIVGEPLCLGGRVFDSGFGTHADSEILVTLPGPGGCVRASH